MCGRSLKKNLVLLLAAACLGGALPAGASVILSGTISNNNQIVGPNDPVTLTLNFANVGDEPFAVDLATASIGFANPRPPDYYTFSFPDLSVLDFAAGSALAVGSSVGLDVTYLPVSGGAPAQAYTSTFTFNWSWNDGADELQLVFDGYNDPPNGGAWTVQAATVPLPATFPSLLAGLAGLACVGRRGKRQRQR
ncbi:MAG: hypothetical protein H6979_09800 [Chromatiales bacterium]|nr:hypothetical protein [Chromatiales bacterium]